MLQAKLTPNRAILSLLATLSLMIVGPGRGLAGQEVPDTSRITISGTIFDSQTFEPVLDGDVRFSGTDFVSRTDEEGRFALEGLVAGNYLLVAEAPGYQQLRVALRVERTGSLNIPMEPLTALAIPGRSARIVGRVREAESVQPVEGAEVTFSGVPGFQITDSDGRFEFLSIPQGFTTLSVRYMGREPMTDEVEVPGPETLELDIRLVPDPVQLEPMVVTVTRLSPYLEDMGYYKRRDQGYSGQHINREFIDERNPRDMGDLFQNIPGMRVDYDGFGRFQVLMRRSIQFSSPGTGCVPKVFVDDIPSDSGWLENIQPQRVEGVEVYGGANAPLRYNDPCGVILVWTRRGSRGGQGAR